MQMFRFLQTNDRGGSTINDLAAVHSIQEILLADLPTSLRNIHTPPKQLYVSASADNTFRELMKHPRVAIVGSRRVTPYGHAVTRKFASELAARGVVIISGLAYGVDAIAHQAAVEAGGLALAVLPSPVESVYPAVNRPLAERILRNGGALVSEYPDGMPCLKQNFVARNRIVSGLANALLITEAAEDSGTMHTARFALEQGSDVLAVPGNITSPTSVGTNNLIKSGALPITEINDIMHALKLGATAEGSETKSRIRGANPSEQIIIDLLEQGITDGSQLLSDSGLTVDKFNHHLTMLEITAKIRPLSANQWGLQ